MFECMYVLCGCALLALCVCVGLCMPVIVTFCGFFLKCVGVKGIARSFGAFQRCQKPTEDCTKVDILGEKNSPKVHLGSHFDSKIDKRIDTSKT